MNRFKTITTLILAALATTPVLAQESGFLSDYSKLEAREGDEYIARVYVSDGFTERLGDYNAIMVDQPEVFFAEDNKYKGAKPDALKQLADTMRMAMMERLDAGGYPIAEERGQDVLFLRWAITDLYLKKKKRSVLSYSPLGQVVHYSRQAAIKDLWKKIDIVEMGIEIELLDSVTEEQLAAITDHSGSRKTKSQDQELVTWEELDAQMKTIGERFRCRLDNTRLGEASRVDCTTIFIEPVYEEES